MYTPFGAATNRKLAIVLIAIGILMAPDMTVPTPFMDLLINVPLSLLISDLTGMSFQEAMLGTFILAYVSIAAGLLIYPYNTKDLLLGRLKAGLGFLMSHPYTAVAALIGLFLIWYFGDQWFRVYYDSLKAYVLTLGAG